MFNHFLFTAEAEGAWDFDDFGSAGSGLQVLDF